MTNVLVTGAAGFVGHHVLEGILKATDWNVVGLVRVGKVGQLRRINEVMEGHPEWNERVRLIWHDLQSPIHRAVAADIGPVDYILHLAAESHVDRSIADPRPFVMANVLGTMHMLDFAREAKPRWFVQFSTDEVYGPAAVGVFHKETDAYNATNPYSATKAGAEQLTNAYANCYSVPVMITNTMNVLGERQDGEKFCSLVLRKVLAGETVTIHADASRLVAGSRHYIHARNVCAALLFLLANAPPFDGRHAQRYNIVGEEEIDNLSLAQTIAAVVGMPLSYEMVNWHTSSRPGHDLRYALDGSKMREMGWVPPMTFGESLEKTIRWTLSHPEWLR
jgi:dTDP-glucose 4,6-dehydratase